MNKSRNIAVAVGMAGAIALSATALSAAPVTSSTVGLKNAVPSDVIQTRSRGWRGAGAAAGIGFAAGAILGAAAASSHAYGYHGGPYAYDYGYAPAYSYGYAPAYSYGYAPAYGYAPGPGIYAGPQPYYYRPANPALGTIHGASVTD